MSYGRFLTWVALVASLAALIAIPLLYDKISDEGRDRRDQSCRLDERAHLEDVQQLRRTYDYLLHPGKYKARRGSDLYNVVLAQLSRTERLARVDRAPAFCDEPGVGIPEPDPKLPRRPKNL